MKAILNELLLGFNYSLMTMFFMVMFPIDSSNTEDFYLKYQLEDYVLHHTAEGKWFVKAKGGKEYPANWGASGIIDGALLQPVEITEDEYLNF